jgi:hypothetical protein
MDVRGLRCDPFVGAVTAFDGRTKSERLHERLSMTAHNSSAFVLPFPRIVMFFGFVLTIDTMARETNPFVHVGVPDAP